MNMKTKLLSLLAAGSFILLTTACEKGDKKDDTAQTAEPSSPTPQVKGAQGYLVAVSTATQVSAPIVGTYTQFLGTAVGSFKTSSAEGVNAGTITCEGKTLKYENGAYVFMPSASELSIDFTGDIDWKVKGQGDVPAITYAYKRGMPEIGALTAGSEVDVSADLTFGVDLNNTYTSLSSADSVMLWVHGPKKSISKTVAASVAKATFTSDELKETGTGEGYLQAAAYNYGLTTVSGYKVAFVNEGVFTSATKFK